MGRGGQEGAAGVGLAPPKPPARSRGGSGGGAPGGALAPGGSRSRGHGPELPPGLRLRIGETDSIRLDFARQEIKAELRGGLKPRLERFPIKCKTVWEKLCQMAKG